MATLGSQDRTIFVRYGLLALTGLLSVLLMSRLFYRHDQGFQENFKILQHHTKAKELIGIQQEMKATVLRSLLMYQLRDYSQSAQNRQEFLRQEIKLTEILKQLKMEPLDAGSQTKASLLYESFQSLEGASSDLVFSKQKRQADSVAKGLEDFDRAFALATKNLAAYQTHLPTLAPVDWSLYWWLGVLIAAAMAGIAYWVQLRIKYRTVAIETPIEEMASPIVLAEIVNCLREQGQAVNELRHTMRYLLHELRNALLDQLQNEASAEQKENLVKLEDFKNKKTARKIQKGSGTV